MKQKLNKTGIKSVCFICMYPIHSYGSHTFVYIPYIRMDPIFMDPNKKLPFHLYGSHTFKSIISFRLKQ